jgi:hypothetical protein
VGTYITYVVGESTAPTTTAASGTDTSRSRAVPIAKIQILGADGRVERELSGPGTDGAHRVLWDLRSAMPFLPAPSDSGFYGTYRGPFVLAGRYTAKLTLGGKEQSQQFDVRADARANAAPAALAARQAMSARIAELSGTYAAAAKAFSGVEAEVARFSAALKAAPNASAGADTVVADVAKKVAELKGRFSPSYGTPIGRVYDLLGALQSSSGPPTEAEGRILDSATGDLRDAITKLNEIISTTMPAVRTRVGSAGGGVVPVKVP